MTSTINNGGPAFPAVGAGGIQRSDGMTLRDYFAGQALIGLLAGERDAGNYHERMVGGLTADSAYEFADAMIAARDRLPST